MVQILKTIDKIGMVPVMALSDVTTAIPLAKALQKGGIPVMEIMFRTPQAPDCIKAIADAMPDFIVGAGTVLTIEQVKCAVDHGAMFIVSPGSNPEIIKYCTENNIIVIPGCVTPSEIEQALGFGIEVVKFFPALQMGGISTINEVSGPYPSIKFMVTGSLQKYHIADLLVHRKVSAVGGDFMLTSSDITTGDFEHITLQVKETIADYLNFHIAHIGVNCNSSDEAKELCEKLSVVLGQKTFEFEKCFFSGSLFEVMKNPFYYEKGHIAIGTSDVKRAKYQLEQKGFVFMEETSSFDTNGDLKAIYLKENFGGYALHLLKD